MRTTTQRELARALQHAAIALLHGREEQSVLNDFFRGQFALRLDQLAWRCYDADDTAVEELRPIFMPGGAWDQHFGSRSIATQVRSLLDLPERRMTWRPIARWLVSVMTLAAAGSTARFVLSLAPNHLGDDAAVWLAMPALLVLGILALGWHFIGLLRDPPSSGMTISMPSRPRPPRPKFPPPPEGSVVPLPDGPRRPSPLVAHAVAT